MENVYNALDQVISCITESDSYQKCISCKDKMEKNEKIQSLIEKIKSTQKKYVKSNYDSKIKEELDDYHNQLIQIPLYHDYQESLEEVNQMIDTVRESMNDYFYQLLNEKKN